MTNSKLYNRFISDDNLIHVTPVKFIPKIQGGKAYLPLSKENVLTSMRFVLVPQGCARYVSVSVPLQELATVFPFNISAIPTKSGYATIPQYVQMISQNYTKLCLDNKLVAAWVTLHSYIQGVNDLVKEVQTSDEARDMQTDASALAPYYQAQETRNQLVNALVQAGLKSSTVYQILHSDAERTRYLALAPLYDVELPQDHQLYYDERNAVSQVGTYAPDTKDSGTETDCLLCIHDDNPKYTADDYSAATHVVEVVTHRYTQIELTLDEDICILQTLYYFNLAKMDNIFRAQDNRPHGLNLDVQRGDGWASVTCKKHSGYKTYDMEAAPTTIEEFDAWKRRYAEERTQFSYRDELTSDAEEDNYSEEAYA